MQRIPEPELMNDEEQARAYALADFEEPHGLFVELFRETFPGEDVDGKVLDLGCGPGDITLRFAKAYPLCHVDALDGAENMLKHGREAAEKQRLAGRISWLRVNLPTRLPEVPGYDALISNSLLHHLADPGVLWQTLKAVVKPDGPVFIMDLMRPESEQQVGRLVQQHAAGEPEILQRDFYHSLCAAYRVEEVEAQLARAHLSHLNIREVSDRHLLISGRR